jgi:hypothetical protein
MAPESVHSISEGFSLSADRQEEGADGSERLQVVLAGEGAVLYSDGAVRIPLEITLGGASRRLVVSIAIEQD